MAIISLAGVLLLGYVLFLMPMGPPAKRRYASKYRCPSCGRPMYDVRDSDMRAVERDQYKKYGGKSGHWCGFCCSDRII